MYAQVLGTLGLTQAFAETLLIFGIIAIGIGMVLYMFWHYILIGLGVIGVLMVFAHHTDETKPTEPPAIEQAKKEYMDDCNSLTHKPELCEETWEQQDHDVIIKQKAIPQGFVPANQVQLLDVDNQEYKTRRAEALKKPGAIILQDTLR